PGMFMFHAHKTEFTMKGWMGMFNVTKPDSRGLEIENGGDDSVSNIKRIINNNDNTITISNENQNSEESLIRLTSIDDHSVTNSSASGLVGI
ncbi:MAG: hypothetical protein ACTHL3_00235, partial [Candidatus Nitrosocosmicus sp.]